jgi:hypothetical protein
MPPTKPDLILNEIAEPRRILLDVSQIRPGRLTLLEALDLGEASGIEVDNFVSILESGSTSDKARLLYAFAWVLARRAEPDLTYTEVCTYNLTVQGKIPTDADRAADAKRAKAVASVAKLAGVTPREAEAMTMAEVRAVTELAPKRTRAQPIRRRRAG